MTDGAARGKFRLLFFFLSPKCISVLELIVSSALKQEVISRLVRLVSPDLSFCYSTYQFSVVETLHWHSLPVNG